MYTKKKHHYRRNFTGTPSRSTKKKSRESPFTRLLQRLRPEFFKGLETRGQRSGKGVGLWSVRTRGGFGDIQSNQWFVVAPAVDPPDVDLQQVSRRRRRRRRHGAASPGALIHLYIHYRRVCVQNKVGPNAFWELEEGLICAYILVGLLTFNAA